MRILFMRRFKNSIYVNSMQILPFNSFVQFSTYASIPRNQNVHI